ncbi:MAG: DJ-1/PfpI family protein [Halieaceae bacterium]|nr:DJ-1/PfpI family protein [Halieaceae bacterium]
MAKRRVGAVIYPGWEMLDTFGPLEMYSVLGAEEVEICMVAEEAGPVAAALGSDGPLAPRVYADYGFDDAPALDIVVLPGGSGTFPALESAAMLDYLRKASETAEVVTSVCTGSALLAKAGLLDGLRATTNKQFFALARMQSDQVEWVEEARWVDAGKFVTSSGVSAGMDMTLAVIARLWSPELAETAADYAEYTWHRDADTDPFYKDLDKGSRQLGLV